MTPIEVLTEKRDGLQKSLDWYIKAAEITQDDIGKYEVLIDMTYDIASLTATIAKLKTQ